MLCTTEIMAYISKIVAWAFYLENITWAICLTYRTVHKASPETLNTNGFYTLFGITSIDDWNKGNPVNTKLNLNMKREKSQYQF